MNNYTKFSVCSPIPEVENSASYRVDADVYPHSDESNPFIGSSVEYFCEDHYVSLQTFAKCLPNGTWDTIVQCYPGLKLLLFSYIIMLRQIILEATLC